MMIWKHRLLVIVSIFVALALLADCGQNSSNTGAQADAHEPSPTPAATTATTAPTNAVTLHVGAAVYHTNDTIEVILSNASNSTIFFSDHLTNCTVIQLQRQVNGSWEAVNKCLLMIATRLHTLDAGQSLTVKLIPSANRPWSVGLYQAT